MIGFLINIKRFNLSTEKSKVGRNSHTNYQKELTAGGKLRISSFFILKRG